MEQTENLTEEIKGEVKILRVKGKLDSVLSPELEKKVCQSIHSGQNKILLDLTDVSYINSAGLRMLLAVKKQVKTAEGIFMVCCLKDEVVEIMKICGFDHVLDITETEEEALRKF